MEQGGDANSRVSSTNHEATDYDKWMKEEVRYDEGESGDMLL